VKFQQYKELPDAAILDLYYSDKDPEWLGLLLTRYTILLLGVCMKYLKDENEAREGVQQIFLKVLTEAPKYKIEYFKSWLYMVAKNYCLMKIRERNKRVTSALSENLQAAESDKAEIEENELNYELLEESINELAEEQKQCIILFYVQKYSYQQICEKSGYTLMQVKSYIQNGKRNLKLILERKLSTIRKNKI
jgi:RNA polymerase sigma factor (sigma-70 family)